MVGFDKNCQKPITKKKKKQAKKTTHLSLSRVMTCIRHIGVKVTFGLWIVFVITRISLHRGSVPYILL